MLSDSCFHAAAEIWDAIERYDYAEDHKESLVNALTELVYVDQCLWYLTKDHERLGITKEKIRQWVLGEWDRRRAEAFNI